MVETVSAPSPRVNDVGVVALAARSLSLPGAAAQDVVAGLADQRSAPAPPSIKSQPSPPLMVSLPRAAGQDVVAAGAVEITAGVAAEPEVVSAVAARRAGAIQDWKPNAASPSSNANCTVVPVASLIWLVVSANTDSAPGTSTPLATLTSTDDAGAVELHRGVRRLRAEPGLGDRIEPAHQRRR